MVVDEIAAARFAGLCGRAVALLPFGLDRVVPPTLLGFAVINGVTFGVDLALLTVFRGVLGWPIPLAVSIAYGCAVGLAFVLNRALNFRSHGPLGRQASSYVVVVIVNYVALVVGVTSVLAWAGVEYHVARIVAGGCEAAFMYSAMRWIVFRRAQD